ncbi:hypothetical protein SARC_01663 [Sphaeroforma arctica JP610]|uniref:Uncharacterized protein n=1 Tax=Sphaeroforma arctica JP610 TaxID=667725 RepID=A0A0L0GBB8_9EUKA|nr:hypothetical protein SARC_01663 [Sphaeroforma arctica JP610]KNC86186.1 hypothetical protein SARC_01663 [Sphaeroforma arctica JP610]|eukprot:XP_014160088.1 hypothetical protein SARC_01663 [Sphaeroforma arctica JP610]
MSTLLSLNEENIGPQRCARLWILSIMTFITFLITLLLIPEYYVYKNFVSAECKVTDKSVYSFFINEAKIANFVTVYDEEGEVTERFEAYACNPIDCDSKSGGFMDKQTWLRSYNEGQVYPCMYSPMHATGGYNWVTYDPVPYSYSIMVMWVVMGLIMLISFLLYLHSLCCAPVDSVYSYCYRIWVLLRDDFGMGEKASGCWVAFKSLLPCRGCRSYKYTRQMDYEMDVVELDEHNEPPSYEGPSEPPPDYGHVYHD